MSTGNIQAILFDNKKWTPSKAILEIKKLGLKPIKRVHKTENYLRYRLNEPSKYKKFITKKVKNGIRLVIGSK